MEKKIAESANTSDADYGKIRTEMEDAVEKVLSTADTDPDAGAGEAVETVKEEGKKPASVAAFEINDDQLARAIKAGLSVADARAIPNAEMFDRLMTRLEATAAKPVSTDEGKSADDGKDDSADDDIPQLPGDKDFDEDLVRAFRQMGAALKEARNEIRSLKKAGASAEANDWFDRQIGGLDEGLRKSIDDGARAKLRMKFDTLEAGYKATKAAVDRADVFKEAVSLALGDLAAKAKSESRAAALERRASLHIAPPGGEPGNRRTGKTEDDALREVAHIVSEKFGN